MLMPRLSARALAIVVVTLGAATGATLPGAAQGTAARSVNDALRHYGTLVARMAHDSIAALYTPDGELSASGRPPKVGPAAIQAYLESFSAYHVIKYDVTSDRVTFRGDTAFQNGHWSQLVVVPAGDTVPVTGLLLATWLKDATGHWLLRRMATAPPPSRR